MKYIDSYDIRCISECGMSLLENTVVKSLDFAGWLQSTRAQHTICTVLTHLPVKKGIIFPNAAFTLCPWLAHTTRNKTG